MRTCRVCKTNDPTVAYRERMPRGLAVLCVECYLDERTSNTVQLTVKAVRAHNDRYSRMAERYGVS